jgi:P4 family phage/plasmid primase-like protien
VTSIPAAQAEELEGRLAAAVAEGLEANFARWLAFCGAEHGEWLELQALKIPTRYGKKNRFAHADSVAAALPLLRQGDLFGAQGVFVIANRVNPAVATRTTPRQWYDAEKGASTTDRDVTHRRVLFVDVDALRTAGTSATDQEMAHSVGVALGVYERLAEILGGTDALAYGHSGNGRQVFVAIDPIAEPSPTTATVKGILAALSIAFAAPGAEIDRTVADAKRLVPAFGTVKRKGAPEVADRPHRRTGLVCAETVARVAPTELDRVLSGLLEPLSLEQRRQVDLAMGRKTADPWRIALKGTRGPGGSFSRANAVPIEDVARALGLFDDESHVRCPGCANVDGVALVNNGLKCHHRTCADRGVPGTPGFRTPVDLVAEARQLEPADAARWLLETVAGEAPEDRPRRRAHAEADEDDDEPPAAPPPPEDGDFPSGFIGRDFPLTDGGNAERFAAHHGEDVRHCHDWKKWLVWDSVRWCGDRRGAVEYRAFQTIRAIPAEAARAPTPKRQRALRAHATASDSASAIGAMLKVARSRPELTVIADELDANPWVLNAANGTIDLRTGALRRHARADNITKVAPVPFDARAECPRWTGFLSDIMGGNAELVSFLQRAVGYSLSGSVDEQVLFFLHGSGSNGKSTFLRALLELFGDYGLQTAPDLLLAKNTDAHPTAIADLFGRRVAVCQEIENGRTFAEATVKQLTGGDIVRARHMREDFWSFKPTHKLFLAANHKPTVRGTDHAIWRRIRLVPFTVTIGDDRKDPQLLEKLLAERAGILRWAVDGCLDWQRRGGLCAPKEVVEATTTYRQEQDVVGEFVEDRCDVAPHFLVVARDLHREYRAWCEVNGYRELSAKSLGAQLVARGFVTAKKNHQRSWTGLRVRLACDPTDVRAPEPGDDEPKSFFEDL